MIKNKHAETLKVKVRKIYHVNTNQKEVGRAKLMRQKYVLRQKALLKIKNM